MKIALRNSRYVGDRVYRKTEMGVSEIETPQLVKRIELRRLLDLVDGRRTVDGLASDFRSREVLPLLAQLGAMGLVEPLGGAASVALTSASEEIGVRSPLTVAQFESARKAAVHATTELLGSTAKSHLRQLQSCRDSAALRDVIEAVKVQLRKSLGDDAAAIFVETVRSAAKRG